MRRTISIIWLLSLAFPAFAQTTSPDALSQSIEELTDRVSRAVVELNLTGFVRPIHAINKTPVISVQTFRQNLKKIQPCGTVVLQVERDGVLGYLGFRFD